MAEFNNIASFKSGNRFLNFREGTNDAVIFDIHDYGSPISHSIPLSKTQATRLMDILLKKYGKAPAHDMIQDSWEAT